MQGSQIDLSNRYVVVLLAKQIESLFVTYHYKFNPLTSVILSANAELVIFGECVISFLYSGMDSLFL